MIEEKPVPPVGKRAGPADNGASFLPRSLQVPLPLRGLLAGLRPTGPSRCFPATLLAVPREKPCCQPLHRAAASGEEGGRAGQPGLPWVGTVHRPWTPLCHPMVSRLLWSQTSQSREGKEEAGPRGEEPHGRVSRPYPHPSQQTAEQVSGEGAGARRAHSWDHSPGIFPATRVGKGRLDCLLRLKRQGVPSAGRNSCPSPSSPDVRRGRGLAQVSQQGDF